MMMKKLFLTLVLAGAGAMVSCAQPAPVEYAVDVKLPASLDDHMAYLVSYDSGEKLDSTIVSHSVARFTGKLATPEMVRVVCDSNRMGMFILEQGSITYDQPSDVITGSELNDRLQAVDRKLTDIEMRAKALPADSTREAAFAALEQEYVATINDAFNANADNPLGFYLFIQQAMEMNLAELDAALAKYPQFAQSKRVEKLRGDLLIREETSPGHKFKDFEVTHNGVTTRLSDYAGKGRYTLVDFWASWCGPCRRAMPVIKELYNKYHGKGLDVVGVAVWDEPAKSEAAAAKMELPWPQMINAGTVPTDLYGIPGIPCIILIDPQGMIVSRDKHDQELIDDVDAAMATYVMPAAESGE